MNPTGIEAQGVCPAALTQECFLQDVLTGLSLASKRLPCKYFYDETGANLFERICELEEYYPTRTEAGILRRNIREMSALPGPEASVLELGSGSSTKTRLLLDHLERPSRYIPVDVAREQLLESSACLSRVYPEVEIIPVCADYTRHFELPFVPSSSNQTLVFFPGSTIGNFEPDQARVFLRRIAEMCGPESGFLIGVDLKKDSRLLHDAYNDSQGVTAQFNLNVLARANRELDADFDLESFQHQARYDEVAGRIEMHLVSRKRQHLSVNGHRFTFARGESIVTEHSYKYSLSDFSTLAAGAGLDVLKVWTDANGWFSVQYLVPLHPNLPYSHVCQPHPPAT
ncbi:MAG: Methyltransferase [Pedosphaera sp.]|nr:Methyltransferase [Pedosphaera sp.]